MMSNARARSGRGGGQRPRNGQPSEALAAGQPQGPMGPSPYVRKEKDSLTSKIINAKNRYKDLCDDVPGHRFRVRGEILDSNEEYITVEFGCNVAGVIALQWQEYSSAELEVRYGPQLDLARKVNMMIRRSVERLGYPMDTRHAITLRGTAEETRLLMSNKDYKLLLEREAMEAPRGGFRGAPAAPPPAAHAAGPVVATGSGYYARRDEEARLAMEQSIASHSFANEGTTHFSWADDGELAPTSQIAMAATSPTSKQEAATYVTPAHGQQKSDSVRLKAKAIQPASPRPPVAPQSSFPSSPNPLVGIPLPSGNSAVTPVPAPTTSGGR